MSDDFDPDFASIAEYAAEYHKYGLTPVPCKYPRDRSDDKKWKHPYVEWRKEQYAQISLDKLHEWFGNNAARNIGLLTGAASNGVFIVDLDLYKDKTGEAAGWWQESLDMQEKAGEIEDTWTAVSGSGGKHYYYRMPEGWSAPQTSTDQNVDFRGQGGFIIVPPSVNNLGQSYKWVEGKAPWESDLAVAPMWFCKRIDDYMAVCLKNKPKIKSDRSYSFGTGGYEEDPYTGEIKYKDGRERNCYQWSYRGAMELRAQFLNGGYPTDQQIKEAFLHSYHIYLSKNLPKDEEKAAYPDLTDEEILETVGRGLTAYSIRFNTAMAKWDGDLLEAAKNPRKKESDNSFEEKIHVENPNVEEDYLEILDLEQIRNLPDPVFLVDGMIIEQSLSFIAGAPGAGKSFVAQGLGLSIASGKDNWMGRPLNQKGGVIYVTPEGTTDIKFRIAAWEKHFGKLKTDAPFKLIRQSVNLMEEKEVIRLIRSIERKAKEIPEPVRLIVFDTLSRMMPGSDENLQKDMTLFIKACDKIREKFDTTVLGVHHLSRNGTGQMRGSTVLDGAADSIFIIDKDEEDETANPTMFAKKIKSARDGWKEAFQLKEVKLGFHDSLVALPLPPEATKVDVGFGGEQETGYIFAGGMKMEVAIRDKILTDIVSAWDARNPWSMASNMTGDSRHIIHAFPKSFGKRISESKIKNVIMSFISNDWISVQTRKDASKLTGLNIKFDPRKISGSSCGS